ncbi:hypothetical protein EDD22DRAFT_1042686 [Suillus occidentalis]|nr:hypothetical protein EDD22DRAFT_1042686 [Suillus occidentalis]
MISTKICLLLCATGAQYYALTPPNARPSTKELLNPTGFEVVTPWIHIILKSFIGVCVFSDIILAYTTGKESSAASKSITTLLVHSDFCSLTGLDYTMPSPALVAGSFLSVIGGAIRIHCYSTLGRLFTYAGGLCVLLGFLLCHFHTRSWLVSCSGVFPSSDQGVKLALGCIWAGCFGVLYSGLGERIQKEEAMLQGNFGDQWKSYVNRVPYRLIPWLF